MAKYIEHPVEFKISSDIPSWLYSYYFDSKNVQRFIDKLNEYVKRLNRELIELKDEELCELELYLDIKEDKCCSSCGSEYEESIYIKYKEEWLEICNNCGDEIV